MPPLHQIIFDTILLIICGFAVVGGGAPERVMGCALFAADVLSVIVTSTIGLYATIEVGVAVVDAVLFILTVVLALTSARFWPILMASMLGCELFGHLAKPLGPDIVPKAYYAMVAIWGYPTQLLLAVATWRHRVRLRRYGIDYGWVQDVPQRYREGWAVDEARSLPPQP